MKRKILTQINIILLLFITILHFTSCDYKYSWVDNVFLDYRFKPVLRNGDFSVSATMRNSSITELDLTKQEVVDIKASNAWIEVAGPFVDGDMVNIKNIIVNKDTLPLNYSKVVQETATDERIYFENDTAYMRFMQKALDEMVKDGYVNVKVNGSINTEKSKIYVTLCHNVDIYVRE